MESHSLSCPDHFSVILMMMSSCRKFGPTMLKLKFDPKFQSNANRPLSDSHCFVVKKFKCVGGCGVGVGEWG